MSAAPKTPLDEARDALAALYEFTTARDEARDAAYRDYWTSKIDNADARDPEHLRVALAEVDRLTAENGRLREALTALVTDCADTPMRDSRHYVAACAALDKALTERDEARQQLAEALARVAPATDTGDCRTCKWADAAACHNPEGKRKNSPVWTWCAHALAEDLVTRLGTSPPCPGYTKK